MNAKSRSGNQSCKYFHKSLPTWAGVLLLLLFGLGRAEAASFQNLGFERGTFVPVPPYPGESVDPVAAFPGWTVFWDTNLAPFVLYDSMAMDSANVSILDTNAPYGLLPRAFQGRFTVVLQGGFALYGYPYVRYSVAIAQTGLIPVSASTLLFDAALQFPGGTNFAVSVAGDSLPVYALATSNNYVLYGVDVSGFAGQTVEIRFTAYPRPPPGLAINNVYLDDIRFSSTPVLPPEFTYVTNNGAITITKYNGPGGAVTIPSTIYGLPVASIGDQACYQCTSVTSVTIPNSVTNIGSSAFERCANLASVNVPTGITSIADFTFEGCSSLANVTIPTGVTRIGGSAFENCTGLTSVMIPDSVTSIGDGAFGGCTSLTTITVGALNPAYSSLGGVLFDKDQTKLVQFPGGKAGTYTIPNTVTTIGNSAFSECRRLTSVTIPSSVASIGDFAFYESSSLTSIYFRGDAPSLGGSSVFDQHNNATIYYLPGTSGWGPTFGGRPTALWNPLIFSQGPSFGVGTNGFGFTITGTPNIPMTVEASPSLADAVWVPLLTCTLTNGSLYFSDPNWANYPARFYRIRSP